MKKIQMYVDPHKDKVLYELIEELEADGKGTRGYVADQLKERLKTFELLARTFGEKDPMALALKLAAGARPTEENADKKDERENPVINNDILEIGNSVAFYDEE
jgi:hypothetical protein